MRIGEDGPVQLGCGTRELRQNEHAAAFGHALGGDILLADEVETVAQRVIHITSAIA